MRKANVPGSAIFGFALLIVCLCGLIKNLGKLESVIPIVLICLAVLAVLFFFSLKKVNISETEPEDYTKKQPKSKFRAASEKDTEHMKRMLEVYRRELEDIRRKSRNGMIYAGIALVFGFVMWGSGRFAITFFMMFSLVCVVYAGWCLWTYFLNSDDPEAVNVAMKFNITTLPMKIEETENIIWMNEKDRQEIVLSEFDKTRK
jgi:fatty acid desaturase